MALLGGECFPTLGRGRDVLISLWQASAEGQAAKAKGAPRRSPRAFGTLAFPELRTVAAGAPPRPRLAAPGAPLSPVEAHRARKAAPVPRSIGCPYATLYCEQYW